MTIRTRRQTTPNLAGYESFASISSLTLVVEKEGLYIENIGNLSKGVFKRSTSTGIGRLALFGNGFDHGANRLL